MPNMSDSTDFEMDVEPATSTKNEEAGFVGVFAGRTQKGYVPYNPHKVNQDWMLIKDDVASSTLILGTFDGHGEHGHCVSEVSSCKPLYRSLSALPSTIISSPTANSCPMSRPLLSRLSRKRKKSALIVRFDFSPHLQIASLKPNLAVPPL